MRRVLPLGGRVNLVYDGKVRMLQNIAKKNSKFFKGKAQREKLKG
jgi:hypothetical protein